MKKQLSVAILLVASALATTMGPGIRLDLPATLAMVV